MKTVKTVYVQIKPQVQVFISKYMIISCLWNKKLVDAIMPIMFCMNVLCTMYIDIASFIVWPNFTLHTQIFLQTLYYKYVYHVQYTYIYA